MAYSPITANQFTVPGSAAGFLDIRKKGTTGPVVTVAVPAYTSPTQPGQLTTYTVADNRWSDGKLMLPALNGVRRNAFSSFTVQVPAAATVFNVRAACDLEQIPGYTGDGSIGAFVTNSQGATTFQYLNIPAGSVATKVPVTLPVGARTIQLMLPDIARLTKGTNTVAGAVLLDIETDAVPTFVAPVVPVLRAIVFGDSIVGGGGTGTGQYSQSWVRGLATLLVPQGGRVTADQFSGGSLVEEYGTASYVDRPAVLARILSQGDASGSNVFLCTYGTNDDGRDTATPTEFGAAYAALVDDVHAARPAWRVLAMTPLRSGLSYESTLEDYRNQIRALATSRTWLEILEGPSAMTGTPNSGDNVHPGPAQHAQIANYAYTKITGLTGPVTQIVPNSEFDTPLVADNTQGFRAASGAATIANGTLIFTNSTATEADQVDVVIPFESTTNYAISLQILSLSPGSSVSALSYTAVSPNGASQIAASEGDPTDQTGVITKLFTTLSGAGPTRYAIRVSGSVTLGYLRVTKQ